MVKSTSSFLDKLRAEKTRLRYDNEPAMRQLAEKLLHSVILVQPSWSQSIVQSIKVLEESKELINENKLPHQR